MDRRSALESLLKLQGTNNVYYQPPSGEKMDYPAIVYTIIDISNTHANNAIYKQDVGYSITVLDKSPNSIIVQNVSKLATIKFNRAFKSSGIYHTLFTIYT